MKATPPIVLALCLLLAAALSPWSPRGAAGINEAVAARSFCPTITTECPSEAVRPGTLINFKAKVSGAGAESFEKKVAGAADGTLSYRWTVSAGTITSGAEGSVTTEGGKAECSAVVDTTGISGGTEVTATFEVSGLDRSCANSNSCTTVVQQIREPHPVDYYGNIRFEDEKARLDNLAIELQNSPSMHGYIDCYGGRTGRRGEARARCERAKRYLTLRRGIAPDRIVLVDGGFRENLNVGLWVLPPGTNFPPSPTVDPSEVKFTDAPKKRRRRPGSKRD